MQHVALQDAAVLQGREQLRHVLWWSSVHARRRVGEDQVVFHATVALQEDVSLVALV